MKRLIIALPPRLKQPSNSRTIVWNRRILRRFRELPLLSRVSRLQERGGKRNDGNDSSAAGMVMAAAIVVGPLAGMAAAGVREGDPADPHVRSDSGAIVALIGRASDGSPTFRRLLEAIDATNGVVYLSDLKCLDGQRACFTGVTMAEPDAFVGARRYEATRRRLGCDPLDCARAPSHVGDPRGPVHCVDSRDALLLSECWLPGWKEELSRPRRRSTQAKLFAMRCAPQLSERRPNRLGSFFGGSHRGPDPVQLQTANRVRAGRQQR